MSTPAARRVNNQLAFAAQQLQAAAGAEGFARRWAFAQAAVLQLNLALVAYGEELRQATGNVSWQPAHGPQLFRSLQAALVEAAKSNGAVAELARLEEQPHTWVAQIHQWQMHILELPAPQVSAVRRETTLTQPASDNRLIALSQEDGQASFSLEKFAQVLESAKDTIQRQRQESAEF